MIRLYCSPIEPLRYVFSGCAVPGTVIYLYQTMIYADVNRFYTVHSRNLGHTGWQSILSLFHHAFTDWELLSLFLPYANSYNLLLKIFL